MHLFSHELAVKATKVSSVLNLYKDENNYSLIEIEIAKILSLLCMSSQSM